jgi:hypothetical protein
MANGAPSDFPRGRPGQKVVNKLGTYDFLVIILLMMENGIRHIKI